MITEYGQIRNMLNKIRVLQENENDNINDVSLNNSENRGEKIMFDDIQTIGYYTSNDLSSDIKNSVTDAVGQFIKSTGLIIKAIDIMAEDGRVVLKTDTLKNPYTKNIRSITIDTDMQYPELTINGDTLSLSDELVSLLQALIEAYNDKQVGVDNLISSTQFNTNI